MKNNKSLILSLLIISSSIVLPYTTIATANFWTISIQNPEKTNEWITIMDRNIWATSDDIADSKSYWFKFQWWNNFWFQDMCTTEWWTECTDEYTETSTETRASRSDKYENKGYYNRVFVKSLNDDYDYWENKSHYNWLWWWAWDNVKNYRWNEETNYTDRQWPCPDWYHIPSAGEWSNLIKYWHVKYSRTSELKKNNELYNFWSDDESKEFLEYFKLPHAWYRVWDSAWILLQWLYWYYWTSTPYEPSGPHLSYMFEINNSFIWFSNKARTRGYSLRCFKNTYEWEKSDDEIECKSLDYANVRHTVDWAKIIIEWDEVEWDEISFSIFNPSWTKYELWTVTMWQKKFEYKALWEWDQNFLLWTECDNYSYKVTWIKLEENETNLSNFEYKTISIENPDKKWEIITIMDRNLWATTNNITKTESFWYKYQWWNNYWFSDWCKPKDSENCSDSITYAASDKWVTWSDSYNNHWANYTTFVLWLKYRDKLQWRIGVRWWEDDSDKNNRWRDIMNKTEINRQWPCPDWWHVPSAWEWRKLWEFWSKQNKYPLYEVNWLWALPDYDPYNDKPKKAFQKYFKLPDSWARSYADWKLSSYSAWYWTSTPTWKNNWTLAHAIIMNANNIAEYEYSNMTAWYAVRCFKNRYQNVEKGTESNETKTEENTSNKTSNTTNNNTTTSDWKKYKNRDFDEWNQYEILENWYSREMNNAYKFAYANWITTSKSINWANMYWPLTRIAMAKMLTQYAINILWKQPDISKWSKTFTDVTPQQNENYGNAVTHSYQLWIMWQWIDKFRPSDEVTRGEFATALSRMLYWTSNWNPYYNPHISKLKQEWIISKWDPNMKEKRWNVMLMLMRTIKK